MVAIEVICKTFSDAPTESEESLLCLLIPERLRHFPHNDLHDLAENLKHLDSRGDALVLRLFEAAFAREPEPDQSENLGNSAILGMSIQSSDAWNGIHYALAELL